MIFLSFNFKAQKNKELVYQYLDSLEYLMDSLQIQEPVYVMAQAIYETGWFQCKNCAWENNNMFGFRGQNNKYMKFKSWRASVFYYANWQKKRYFKFKAKYPNGDYLHFLKWCKYAQSTTYSSKITWTFRWLIKNWSNRDGC